MQQRSVRDLMRIRHGLVVTESFTLREVAERLIISDCDIIAVTDQHGKLAGVVCESSIVRALLANSSEDTTIQSIVSRHTESVRIDANLSTVLPHFRSCAYTAIPVVDTNGRVCGLLMRTDVIRSLLNRCTESLDTESAAESTSTVASEVIAPINPTMAFTPPKKRTILHAADSANTTQNNQPGPHFLRAEAAHRILWPAEDRL